MNGETSGVNKSFGLKNEIALKGFENTSCVLVGGKCSEMVF